MVVPANVCDVMITMEVNTIPDSVSIMNSGETIYYAQSGFYGEPIYLPSVGPTTYGDGQLLKIYKYDSTNPNTFVLDTTVPNQTITITPQEYPITNTNSNNVPISQNPSYPNTSIRTITWNKGITSNDVNIIIRIVANPEQTNTSWEILALSCLDCSTPCSCVGGEVTIGSQIWSCGNLDVSTYRNGDAIPQVTDPTVWASLTTGAWCHYNNNPANDAIYGKLYNWYAVNDVRGLAPTGYHIPTESESNLLSTYLGGDIVSGGKLKEVGTTYWSYPNAGANNSTCFNGRPGGYRLNDGSYDQIQNIGSFWTSTSYTSGFAKYSFLSYDNVYYNTSVNAKTYGSSVRVIKD
jgi:uncharacterized protein (TIGR02145 family)